MSSTVTVPQTTRPVIFSGPMVLAILEDRKTQTRRIVKPQPEIYEGSYRGGFGLRFKTRTVAIAACREGLVGDQAADSPYGVAGGRLWVRETFQIIDDPAAENPIRRGPNDERFVVDYKADNPTRIVDSLPKHLPNARHWKPSIHMPRWASRITLEITKVRVERLQDISREDAISEGVAWCDYQNKSGDTCERCGAHLFSDDGEPPWHSPIVEYQLLWDSLHGKGAWEKNPWVWVLEFKRHLSENVTRSDSGSEFPKSISGRSQ